MTKLTARRLVVLAVLGMGLSACGSDSEPALTAGDSDQTNDSNNVNDSDSGSSNGSTNGSTNGSGESDESAGTDNNNQSTVDDSLSQVVPAEAGGRCPGVSASGTDTSAIAGLWDASDDDGGQTYTYYLLISSDGLVTSYDYQQDSFGNGGNCYIKQPTSGLIAQGNNMYSAVYYEYMSGDDDQCELVIDDPVTVTVNGNTFTITEVDVDDSDSDGDTTDSITDSIPRVSGVSATDLTICE